MSGCLIGSLFFEVSLLCFSFFFFNDTATTEIYTLSLHDALPILGTSSEQVTDEMPEPAGRFESVARFRSGDRCRECRARSPGARRCGGSCSSRWRSRPAPAPARPHV